MDKFLGLFTRNWLLKLISLILATVLYFNLKEPPSKSGKDNHKPNPTAGAINRGYETMTNTILKALHTSAKPDDEEKEVREKTAKENTKGKDGRKK